MMKEDWTDQIRQKLEGFEMTPPEGLWEGICKQMDMPAEPASASHKRWYWAVAAAILALAGFFAVYHVDDHSGATVVTAKSEIKPVESNANTEKEPKTAPQTEAPKKDNTLIKAKPSTKLMALTTQEKSQAEVAAETEIQTEPEVQSEPEVQTESVASIQEEEHQANEPKKTAIDYPMLTPEPQVRTKIAHEWAVGVNASGGIFSVSTARGQWAATPLDPLPNNEDQTDEKSHTRRSFMTDFYPTTDYDWDHQIPIRLGLGVQYQLNDHLAIISGISYTYLYSEWGKAFLKGGGYEQMLHYIGVPVGIAWHFGSSKHFHFYLSGTTLLEKCISFKYRWQEDQTVNSIRPWQFSIRAAVGAEYTFTPQFGFYLEPSFGYYFNDGSSLQHYYKKRPFAPSLDFGLRLHLK